MVVATILDMWTFPIVDPDDLHGRVIPLFLGWLMVGSPFLELFCGYLVNVKVKPEVKFGSKIISIFVSSQSATSQRNRLPT